MKATKEDAVERFVKKRYNCCQAVICTYCEEMGLKEEDVFRLTEGFGAGMGGLEDTCGAVTGMFMTVCLANSAGKMDEPLVTKMDTYEKIRKVAKEFQEKMGSLYCRDLKNMEGEQPLACCTRCVEAAAEIIDHMKL